MKNNKLRKAVYLSLLSSMLFSGCGKKESNIVSSESKVQATTEEVIKEKLVSNQTVACIINDYEEKSGIKVDYNTLNLRTYSNPKYIWSYIDSNGEEQYVYDFRIDGSNESYKYIDCNSNSILYVVRINTKQGEYTSYETICALLKKDNKVVNVIATTLDDKCNIHNPSDYYVYVSNPTVKNIEELLNMDEYLISDNKEPAITLKKKEYTMLYKSN